MGNEKLSVDDIYKKYGQKFESQTGNENNGFSREYSPEETSCHTSAIVFLPLA